MENSLITSIEKNSKILKINNLEMSYQGVKAVDNVSFNVTQGSITGLIGPNGSGKSTLIDCITGFLKPQAGTWFINNAELTGLPPHHYSLAGISRTFQSTKAFGELSLLESLLIAGQSHDEVTFYKSFFGGNKLQIADLEAKRRALELLEQVNLLKYADAPADILSYGQRKLLALSSTMMTKPFLVILDEPVAGVNQTMVRRIEAIIKKLNESGVTFLIVEHNMEFIMNLCSRVLVLQSGKIIADDEPNVVRQNPLVMSAYLGSAQSKANNKHEP